MRAVQVSRLAGPSAVTVEEVPEPSRAGPHQAKVLIEVHAAGVSFPDLLLSKGEYQVQPELPFTLGVDCAGVVRSAPEDSGFEAGDRVAVCMGQDFGGACDVVLADPDRVFPLPNGLSFEQGAALPGNYLTAHFALVERGSMQRGESVLVHGAAGGVGTAAIQVANGYGARTIAVVLDDRQREVTLAAGANETVLASGFRDDVREITRGQGVDIIVDVVGGDLMTDSLRSLSVQGRLLVVGFAAGEIPQVKVNRLLLNNIDLRGVAWGVFAMARPGYMRRQWDELLPMMASGTIAPFIGAAYPLEDFGRALEDLQDHKTLGKSVVALR